MHRCRVLSFQLHHAQLGMSFGGHALCWHYICTLQIVLNCQSAFWLTLIFLLITSCKSSIHLSPILVFMYSVTLTLWARCAYIYAHTRLSLTAMSIYICTQYTQVPSAPSCQAKQDCGVNPYLLSSNKSRPHLTTYITTRKWQEGAVLMCEWSLILTRASKSEAFSRTNEGNSLQFSLKEEVLPSDNLEMSWNCQGRR